MKNKSAIFVAFSMMFLMIFQVIPLKTQAKDDFIKWVDFDVTYAALNKALEVDIEYHDTETALDWIELLAYLGAKYGGDFSKYQHSDMSELVEELTGGRSIDEMTKDMGGYDYYHEVYSAVLGEFVGKYEIQVPNENEQNGEESESPGDVTELPGDKQAEEGSGLSSEEDGSAEERSESSLGRNAPAEGENGDPKKAKNPQEDGSDTTEMSWEVRYGLKVFSPIAKNFYYGDYDDFGASRDYGYKRRHLGHDMFGAIGTPIVAVESGRVEVLGWNQYGGWRVGIRSFDGLRYYYYAHLRQNRPFHPDIKEGGTVKAGDVIGYMGHTGYSANENVNNIRETHLHFGMQIIFDESQKEGNGEIWIDVYAITELLRKNTCETYRVDDTKEFYRRYDFDEPLLKDR